MTRARFEGKTALVTGAGRGFGSELAKALAAEGGHVAVHYNSSADGARDVAEEVRSLSGRSMTTQADITDWDAVRSMVSEVFDAFGTLDILVNNAGDVAAEQMSWTDVTEELIDRVLALDIKGTMLVTHEVGQRMLDQGHGVIVNVCSNVVVTGSARAPQYAASKYGVLGLTKSYAHAFAPTVRVNAFGPGYLETDSTLQRRDWVEGREEWVVERTPLQKIGDPQELTGVACFLASDDSGHMTGNFVLCDGGFSMVGA